MGSTCSLPEIGSSFLSSSGLNKSTISSTRQPTIETIEQLISRDRKLKKHSCSNNINVSNQKKFLFPFNEYPNRQQANRNVHQSTSNSGKLSSQSSSSFGELSSKVYTFKEYKQYLQSKRETKIISTPVTSLINDNQSNNNQRCRTATIRKLSKDVKSSISSSSSSSSSTSSPLALSTSSQSSSPSKEIELTSSPTENNNNQIKRVTWGKADRKSSASDKESSDDSGISDSTITINQLSTSKSKGRVRPLVNNSGRKICNWPTTGNVSIRNK